jgi:hypothetical protein
MMYSLEHCLYALLQNGEFKVFRVAGELLMNTGSHWIRVW